MYILDLLCFLDLYTAVYTGHGMSIELAVYTELDVCTRLEWDTGLNVCTLEVMCVLN